MKKQALSIGYMFLLTVIFASLVSAVKSMNDKKIAGNQIAKLQRYVLQVLDIPIAEGISESDLALQYAARIREVSVEDKTVYVGYEEDGRTVRGYAVPVGGPGFWGPIEGLVGVTPDASKVMGVAFSKHSETPGLGGRITEGWFTGQFKGLPLFPIEGGNKIFYLTPEGTPKGPHDLDAITGATNTSAAVEAFLNRDLDLFLREIWSSLGE